MTAQRTPAGDPFAGDYPDDRDAEALACERRAVRRQVKSLGDSREHDAWTRSLLEALRQRRATRAEEGVLQFDVVPQPRGVPVLVAAGELLLRREALEDERVRRMLEAGGYTERRDAPDGCEELTELVARYWNPQATAQDLLAMSHRLRAGGVDAAVDHVTPLAAVVKGIGGPEPSAGSRPAGSVAWATGSPVRVAVVDTGVAEEKRGDGWLDHGAVPRTPDNIDVLDAFPAGGDGLLDFATGHGTFATGVVQQVCPDAEIRVYRAVDSDGIGSEVSLGCAIVRAVRDGAQVVNLSVGSHTVDDQPPVALQVALEVVARIEREEQREVLLVAAAGNYGDTRPCWPAAFRRVVAVAGLDADLAPAGWSSHGAWVDCSTVGEGVVSTYLEGEESALIDPAPDHFGRDAWAVWTGTSFAAPQLVGAVARVAQSGRTPRQALTDLLAAGVAVPGYGRAVRILPGT